MLEVVTISVTDLKDLIFDSVAEALKENATPQATPKPQAEYLTRKQTAKKLHISLATLDTYTKLGLLTAVKIGHRVLYRSVDINDSLTEKINSVKFKVK